MTGWNIALPLAIGLAGPEIAVAAEQGVSMVISYADLDLSQQADARRLDARVRSATRAICAQPHPGLLASPSESLCRRTAMVRAQTQINRAVALAASRRILAQNGIVTAAAR